LQRSVSDFDRVGPPRDLQNGGGPAVGSGEVAGEPVRIDSGGGDDDLEVRPTRKYLPQVSEQEVDVEAAFVRLVDDDRVVGAEEPVPSARSEEHTSELQSRFD